MKTKRIASLLLATVIAFAMIPTSALAAGTTPSEPKLVTTKTDGLITDTLEYTFQLDGAAVGEWETYDYTQNPDGYNPNRSGRLTNLWKETGWTGSSIYPDGTLVQRYAFDDMPTVTNTWTEGYMIWDDVVPAYEIKELDGRTYMFIEWKNSDYRRTGEIPGYYVMVKTSDTPAAKPTAQPALTVDDDPAHFVIENGVLTQYTGSGYNLHVVVPEGVKELAPDSLGYHDGIVMVTLPDSLELLDDMAFVQDRFLREINVGIGTKNLINSSNELAIAEGRYNRDNFLAAYGWFNGCYSLERINVDDGNELMYDIDGVPFRVKGDAKELAYYPAGRTDKTYTVPDGTDWIDSHAWFRYNWSVEVTLPASVETISISDLIGVDSIVGPAGSPAESWCQEHGVPFFITGEERPNGVALNIEEADPWAVDIINAAVGKGLIDIGEQGHYTWPIYHYNFAELSKSFIEAETGKTLIDFLRDSGKDLVPYNRDMDIPVTNELVPDILLQFNILCDNLPVRKDWYGNPELDVHTEVTREQLAETIYKLAKMFGLGDPAKAPQTTPSDLNQVTPARVEAVNFCVANGLINGGGNGAFNPKGDITKQEAIVVFYRLSELSK